MFRTWFGCQDLGSVFFAFWREWFVRFRAAKTSDPKPHLNLNLGTSIIRTAFFRVLNTASALTLGRLAAP